MNPDTAPDSLDSAIGASDISTSSVDGLSDFNPLGVAGVGLVAIAGLVTGGILLKARLVHRNESLPALQG